MVKELYDLVIIGGGASGLFLANLLHEKCKVAIIEAKDRVGRKILASGNGKCNLLNQKIDPSKYNNPKFIKSVTERITVDEIINKFSRSYTLYLLHFFLFSIIFFCKIYATF